MEILSAPLLGIRDPVLSFFITFIAAEGDSELSGNAIEASLTGTFRITVLPEATLPPALVSMKAPILETKDYILVHGYAYEDYITELDKPR
jgi:acetamidase/formamidase